MATIRATDPDILGKLEYVLVSGDDGHFALDSASGVLEVVDAVDRETKDVYRLIVRASDGIQYTDTTVTVEVRSLYSFCVSKHHSSQICMHSYTFLHI